jgi:gamma-glutamyltranspeptidase / glutathione hydrolase
MQGRARAAAVLRCAGQPVPMARLLCIEVLPRCNVCVNAPNVQDIVRRHGERIVGIGMTGIVAAGHVGTADAAAAVLSEGGNAVDAALAGLCAATVAEPVLASLGGGGFLVARLARGPHAGRSVVYDFFVHTPRRRRPTHDLDIREVVADFGPAKQAFHIGMATLATPGVIKGVFEAHRDLGHMPLRRIVEPAITLARTGVRVDAMLAYVLRVVRAIIEADPSVRALFASHARPGELAGDGETLRFPELADTLEILAIEGDALFYRGEMAAMLVADCAARGGLLSLDDLRDYRVERRQPLQLDVGTASVQLNPPPALGGILVAFGLALWDALGPFEGGFGSPAHLARLAAVMRATDRARVEHRVDSKDGEATSEAMLDSGLIVRYRNEVLAMSPAIRGTTQISVIDADGGAASASVSNGEGSGYLLPGTGIILNNMLGESDLNPDGLHAWKPNTRMASMMTPALVLDADGGITALGSGGSNRIRTAVLQTLLNLIAFGLPLEDAVAAPRLHVEGDTLSLEPGFDERAQAVLATCFDTIDRWPSKNLFFGGVHAVRRSGNAGYDGAGDERRGGVAKRC